MEYYSIERDGVKAEEWKLDGLLHREDGPAFRRSDGSYGYYINGQPHRVNGVAIRWGKDNIDFYYQNGQLHNEKGYAVNYADGTGCYYIHGKAVTQRDFLLATLPPKAMTISEIEKALGHKVTIKNELQFVHRTPEQIAEETRLAAIAWGESYKKQLTESNEDKV
jgi:hypothetical protein